MVTQMRNSKKDETVFLQMPGGGPQKTWFPSNASKWGTYFFNPLNSPLHPGLLCDAKPRNLSLAEHLHPCFLEPIPESPPATPKRSGKGEAQELPTPSPVSYKTWLGVVGNCFFV